MNELPKREDFLEQLNTKFRIYFDGEEPTEAELTEVSETRQRSDYVAYSLVFQVPKTDSPDQGLYRVDHDVLGSIELFLAPFEENERGFAFESLFNQKATSEGD